ncbi:HNH endonuclease signature motif containing protein [Rathayibacter iranicus]|uniref:HNH endonuclease n=2 Tax=Rathayibacter iranicus TaxID=59737 RepID=A0AAD1AEL8_9MICO|nr:HNH endonuclease [Rathayibacter iranicus]MWV32543.1 hypothetical protein [Rathayibacter iranicus NCPPB 2253 = VKM Ac-1602]PPI60971.1 hypothetical protein C5E08_06355 [Rathayibacter iranicus]
MDWLKNHLGAGGVTVSDEFTPTIQPADPIDGSSVTSDSVVVANTTDTVKHAFTATRDDLLNALGNAEKKLGEVGQNLHPAPELAGGGTLPPGTPLADALTRLFRTTDTSDTPRTNFGGGSGSIGFESRLSNGDVFSASLRGEILTVKDISVRNFEYIKRDRSEATQLRNEFDRRIRSNFLKNLARKEMDLRHLGFDDVDITDLRNGRLPDGYQVHHKHPLDDSGTNDFDNLILMKNQPYHKMMTNYQIEATRSLRVGEGRLVPWPEIPGDVYTGGQR